MIHSVYLCTNGMVAAFDPGGAQLPEYEGRLGERLGELLAAAAKQEAANPAAVVAWYWLNFGQWCQAVSLAQVKAFHEMNFKPRNSERDLAGIVTAVSGAARVVFGGREPSEVKHAQEKPAPAAERPRGRPGRPRKESLKP